VTQLHNDGVNWTELSQHKQFYFFTTVVTDKGLLLCSNILENP